MFFECLSIQFCAVESDAQSWVQGEKTPQGEKRNTSTTKALKPNAFKRCTVRFLSSHFSILRY